MIDVSLFLHFNLSHVLDTTAGPCGNYEDVRPAAGTRSNRCSLLLSREPRSRGAGDDNISQIVTRTAVNDNMVFSKIRGIHLRDFSSVGGNKESESEEDNSEEITEEFTDVITDNLGDIGRSDLQ